MIEHSGRQNFEMAPNISAPWSIYPLLLNVAGTHEHGGIPLPWLSYVPYIWEGVFAKVFKVSNKLTFSSSTGKWSRVGTTSSGNAFKKALGHSFRENKSHHEFREFHNGILPITSYIWERPPSLRWQQTQPTPWLWDPKQRTRLSCALTPDPGKLQDNTCMFS